LANTWGAFGFAPLFLPANPPEIVDAVFDSVIENGVTLRQAMRLLLSGSAGDLAGMDTGNYVFKSLDGTKDRIEATVVEGVSRTVTSIDVT
jgi:hypothetical protein